MKSSINLVFKKPKLYVLENREYSIVLNTETGKRVLLNNKEITLFRNTPFLKEINDDNDCVKLIFEQDSDLSRLIFKMLKKHVIHLWSAKHKNYIDFDAECAAKHPPTDVFITFGDECNLSCVYCYRDAGLCEKNDKPRDYDLQRLKELIEKVQLMGASTVTFTGGEPMLHSHIFLLGEYAKKLGLRTCMLTNGTLISEDNAYMFACFDVVKISLDSIYPHINDMTRGAGTTEKILHGIRLLKRVGVYVTIESVLTKINYKTIGDTIKSLYLNEKVDNYRASHFIPTGRGSLNFTLSIPEEEIAECNKYVFNEVFGGFGNRPFKDFVKDATIENGMQSTCGAGICELLITLTGDVYPCRSLQSEEYFLGNIFQETLDEIKSKKSFSDIRRALNVEDNTECGECPLKYLCAGGCRAAHAAMSGDLRKNNKTWCKLLKNMKHESIWLGEGVHPYTGEKLTI